MPSLPLMPTPTWAVWIMPTSLAPSPIASVSPFTCRFTIHTSAHSRAGSDLHPTHTPPPTATHTPTHTHAHTHTSSSSPFSVVLVEAYFRSYLFSGRSDFSIFSTILSCSSLSRISSWFRSEEHTSEL